MKYGKLLSLSFIMGCMSLLNTAQSHAAVSAGNTATPNDFTSQCMDGQDADQYVIQMFLDVQSLNKDQLLSLLGDIRNLSGGFDGPAIESVFTVPASGSSAAKEIIQLRLESIPGAGTPASIHAMVKKDVVALKARLQTAFGSSYYIECSPLGVAFPDPSVSGNN